jgi:hypothetical protein
VAIEVISATGMCRKREDLAVLAAQASELTEALDRVQVEGWAYVILDGKVVDTDRCRAKTTSRKGQEIDLWYSGKKHNFGGNILAVMRPDGLPIWKAHATTCTPRSSSPPTAGI